MPRSIPLAVVSLLLWSAGCASILGIDERAVDTDASLGQGGETGGALGTGGADASTAGGGLDASAVADARADAALDVVDAQLDGLADVAMDAPVLTPCDGGLFDLSSDPTHCGTCDTLCTLPVGATQATPACKNATCAMQCAPLWADCDTKIATGCEFDVSGDTANCGACGHVCGNRNATPTCAQGVCSLKCSPGTAHCSTDDATGCETTIASDVSNCGACGFACGAGLTCDAGICKYTSGAEMIQRRGGTGALTFVADATTLYWANNNGFAASSTHLIRAVRKDGTGGVRSVSPDATNGPSEDQGSTLALDQSYVYYIPDTYGNTVYKLNKTGAQAAAPVVNPLIGASAVAIHTDGDDTHAAQWIFVTQVLNGSGFYRVPVSSPSTHTLLIGGDTAGFALVGKTVYFGFNSDNSVRYFDNSVAGTPSVLSLTTFPGTARGLATDGSYLYVLSGDGSLYKVDIATAALGTRTTLAVSGPTDGFVATDGKYVYVGGPSGVHKVSVSDSSVPYANRLLVDRAVLTGNVVGLAVDADAVYFATYSDVYKTRK